MTGQGISGDASWYNVQLSDATQEATPLAPGGTASWFFNGGSPPAICSADTAFLTSISPGGANGPQTLYKFNPSNGQVLSKVALEPLLAGRPQANGVACPPA